MTYKRPKCAFNDCNNPVMKSVEKNVLLSVCQECFDAGRPWNLSEATTMNDSRKGQTVTVGGDKYRVLYEWIDDSGNVCFATEKKRPQQVFFHLKDRALRIVFILRERGPLSATAIAQELSHIGDYECGANVLNLVKRMVEHGILFREGAGSKTLWHLVDGWTDEKLLSHLEIDWGRLRYPKYCVDCKTMLTMQPGFQYKVNGQDWCCRGCLRLRLHTNRDCLAERQKRATEVFNCIEAHTHYECKKPAIIGTVKLEWLANGEKVGLVAHGNDLVTFPPPSRILGEVNHGWGRPRRMVFRLNIPIRSEVTVTYDYETVL